MKYTPETALEIALCGKHRMFQQGYIYRADGQSGRRFIVTKPDGKDYVVIYSPNPDNDAQYIGLCECPFSGEGFENRTCKHIEFVRDLEDRRQNGAIYAEIREAFHATGGGLGVPALTSSKEDSRLAKMFAHPSDDIAARLY